MTERQKSKKQKKQYKTIVPLGGDERVMDCYRHRVQSTNGRNEGVAGW